jgi:hypothetical protein
MRKVSIRVALIMTAGLAPASAQSDKVTVSSLLALDYTIAGTLSVPSGGAGLFMRKEAKLYFCFLTETPTSATVATQYCKPVE